ncbi:MAG: nuclear transport factor 2 family protein [Gammaproteobacteria bacterium]|nr:nuclear transport factor 2 family protein [Gammaproteobacteria bacterium]
MAKINPFDSWLPLQARAERETNPRVRSLILAVRDHMEHEIRGDMTKLMATLTAEPVYHFWNPAGPFKLEGRAAVEGFYQNLIAAGGNQFEVVVDTIVADEGGVITEGQVKQVQKGAALLAAGISEVAAAPVRAEELFLTCAQLVTVWPAAPDGKLVGEDIYFGENALATAVRIDRGDLPSGYRL